MDDPRPYFVASVSWGKDSLAMLHLLLDRGGVDCVTFYDTGMEFEAIYAERDRTLPLLYEAGVRYVELRPNRPFLYDMLAKPIAHRDGSVSYGYGWCGGGCRWHTAMKLRRIGRFVTSLKKEMPHRRIVQCVGIAADETDRTDSASAQGKRMPLVEAGLTEADCLSLCYSLGHTWECDGVRLYDVLDRVSCWCCRNKNLSELRAMRASLPRYFDMLVSLERTIGQEMKTGRRLEDI